MNHRSLCLSVGLLTAVFCSSPRAGAASDILLIVNDANRNAVTFTATTNAPLASSSSHNFGQGIELIDFLTAPVFTVGPNQGTGSLTTSLDGSPTLDAEVTLPPGSLVDLLFYNPEFNNTEDFKTGTEAFKGSETFNLGRFLPPAGTIGDIYAGYPGEEDSINHLGNTPVLIGQYYVIPEPSQWNLLLVGAAGLIALRRLRAHRVS
jgi:hypothetical protein